MFTWCWYSHRPVLRNQAHRGWNREGAGGIQARCLERPRRLPNMADQPSVTDTRERVTDQNQARLRQLAWKSMPKGAHRS